MNIESRGRKFPVSEKVYGFMLSAYPPKHRAAYGAAMAQLFRDQCRDAWDESKNFGLLKLWLRVLPDLAKTCIMERLAALNERKTMSDKLSNLASFGPSPVKIFTRVFVTIFLIVATISTAVTFLLPETYASTTTIKIERDENAANKSTYDPYFIQTQFEVMNSPLVLDPVIEKFDLCELWGKKYFNGQQLKQIEAVEILKGRLGIAPVGNTKLAQITFYSEDKNEAAKLANAVAQSYQSLWVNQRAERSKTKVATLKVEYEKESQQIMTAMDKLDGLRKASEGTNAEATAAYTTARLEMQRMTDLHRLHYSKLKALEIDSVLPYSAVEITVPAEPGRSPIKPNKTLNIVLGIFGGVFAAGIIGGLAALVISVRRKRFQSSNAPV